MCCDWLTACSFSYYAPPTFHCDTKDDDDNTIDLVVRLELG